MPEPLRPYRSERYAIGTSLDGHALTLGPMTSSAADALGRQVAAIGPWAHYGLDAGRITAALQSRDDGAVRYQIECGSELAGAVIIHSPWLAGPYLQMLAVLPTHQNRGIGATILVWFEAQARDHFRNLWLCVSAFNGQAQRLYRARGFERVATLEALLRDGDDELLMRKRLAQ
jgi:[ribosomal protein S18]-alanine N-acetyltransferase